MRSNIGFLQVLIFILVILYGFGFIHLNVFLLIALVLVGWVDSYVKVDKGNQDVKYK
jgi:UDP-N-acetylmuramyl pentapeptide phosphotransferase/UDP-N-acetylglucosamine-1-phosphate transferase